MLKNPFFCENMNENGPHEKLAARRVRRARKEAQP